jgi:type I restriction enzyme S subunit
MNNNWETYFLKDLSETRISNGAFNDPKKVGQGYRLINVSDLYTEPRIDVAKLNRLEVTLKEYRNYAVKRGDIFFTRSSLKLEGIAQCNIFDSDVNDVIYECHVMRVRPKKHIILPEYLREYCRSGQARKYFMRHAKTTTMTTIDQDGVGGLPVIVPSLNEQKVIIALISTWSSAIEKTEKLIVAKEKRLSWLKEQMILEPAKRKGHWTHRRMKDIADRVQRKSDGGSYPILTISSASGFMLQEDKYSRFMAGKSVENYTLLRQGEFAYNKGNSLRFQFGCIFQLQKYTEALVPHVYVCFKLREGVHAVYLDHVFQTDYLKQQLGAIVNSGVRNNGLLNIRPDEFMKVTVPLPPFEQQQRIAETLNMARLEIALLEKQVDAYRKQKRGLMQKLMTGAWRLDVKEMLK